MLPFVLSVARIPLMAGLVVLALAACGRRGPPEAPPLAVAPTQPGARAVQAAPVAAGPARAVVVDDDDDEAENLLPAVVPTARPARNQRRGYTIPKEPFILDPLL